MGGQVGTESDALGVLGLAGSQAADPWLWLAGLSVCRKREGVPLPRSGGGWEGADAPAAPYKHRLAHAPGRRSRSGRAFRCVGVLGQSPKRILPTFVRTKVGPRRVGVLTKAFCKALPAVGAHRLYHARQPSPKIANLSHQITPIYLHHLVDFSPKCKLFIKKCCFLTFPMQNSPVSAVLVGGVFLSPPENAPSPAPKNPPQPSKIPDPAPWIFLQKTN